MFKWIREIFLLFGHSTHANARLADARKELSITTGLVPAGGTRFGSSYLSAQSVLKNLPAIHHAYRKDMFSSVPQASLKCSPQLKLYLTVIF
jgi:hypothetical protein